MIFVEKRVKISDFSWFKTGGIASFFSYIQTVEEANEILVFAKNNSMPITIIGGGANILISDEGIDGMVIILRNAFIRQRNIIDKEFSDNFVETDNEKKNFFEIGAGMAIDDAILGVLAMDSIGLEEFSGIPGTIGGAVYMNIHYFNFLFSDYVVGGYVIDILDGSFSYKSKEWFNFGYDYSTLHEKKYILWSVVVALKRGSLEDVWYARGRAVEIKRHRAARYPRERTCGCFFKNVSEKNEKCSMKNGKKILAAGFYLERIGAKEFDNGGAFISEKHANMIVTRPGGKSNDILDLAKRSFDAVYAKYGIFLDVECELLGFSQLPEFYEKKI